MLLQIVEEMTSAMGNSLNFNTTNLLPRDSNQELLIAPFAAQHEANQPYEMAFTSQDSECLPRPCAKCFQIEQTFSSHAPRA